VKRENAAAQGFEGVGRAREHGPPDFARDPLYP